MLYGAKQLNPFFQICLGLVQKPSPRYRIALLKPLQFHDNAGIQSTITGNSISRVFMFETKTQEHDKLVPA